MNQLRFVSALLTAGLLACNSSDTGTQEDAATLPDAAVQSDAASQVDAAPQPDAAACTPAQPNGPTGMNSGQGCLSCHGEFTLAGSLYASQTGGTRIGGATVSITDQNGQIVDLVTGSDGSFFTSQPLSFPVDVEISKCPDTVWMVSAANSGECNGCHGSSNRVHLP
jgi:hypothetical protein